MTTTIFRYNMWSWSCINPSSNCISSLQTSQTHIRSTTTVSQRAWRNSKRKWWRQSSQTIHRQRDKKSHKRLLSWSPPRHWWLRRSLQRLSSRWHRHSC